MDGWAMIDGKYSISPLQAVRDWEQDVKFLRSRLQLWLLNPNIWDWVLISFLSWGGPTVRSLWYTWLHTSNRCANSDSYATSRGLSFPVCWCLLPQMFPVAMNSFLVVGILTFGISDLRESHSICGTFSLLVVETELFQEPMNELLLPCMYYC